MTYIEVAKGPPVDHVNKLSFSLELYRKEWHLCGPLACIVKFHQSMDPSNAAGVGDLWRPLHNFSAISFQLSAAKITRHGGRDAISAELSRFDGLALQQRKSKRRDSAACVSRLSTENEAMSVVRVEGRVGPRDGAPSQIETPRNWLETPWSFSPTCNVRRCGT